MFKKVFLKDGNFVFSMLVGCDRVAVENGSISKLNGARGLQWMYGKGLLSLCSRNGRKQRQEMAGAHVLKHTVQGSSDFCVRQWFG